jgi:hypothetical protein
MKSISDFLGTLFTLFIAGAIVYGGIKEGYAMQTILILAVFFLIIYLSVLRDDNIKKTEQEKLDKENRKKFDEDLKKYKYQMYGFAYNNERISYETFDIEEGGQYHSEYNKNTRSVIDNIVDKHIQFPNREFQKFSPKIQEDILKLSKQPKSRYIGF